MLQIKNVKDENIKGIVLSKDVCYEVVVEGCMKGRELTEAEDMALEQVLGDAYWDMDVCTVVRVLVKNAEVIEKGKTVEQLVPELAQAYKDEDARLQAELNAWDAEDEE